MFWQSQKPESAILSAIPHPYFPVGIEIANYVANDKQFGTLLGIFAVGCAVILGSSWTILSTFFPRVKARDRWICLWFILSGSIHLFFEGYFSYNHAGMGKAQDLFGQMWKEYASDSGKPATLANGTRYAYSDSRYLWSEPFVLCMETITAAFWGPLSYLTVYLITSRNPFRYPLQAIVSLGQIYGDILYYATSMFQSYHKNIIYCRPEAYYFWFYFVFMNFIWIVIPGLLLYQSVTKTAQAFSALDRMSKSLQGNGGAKGSQTNGQVTKKKA